MKTIRDKKSMFFELMPVTSDLPVPLDQLFKQACQSDDVTVKTWRPTWLGNIKANKERFGAFANHSIGSLFGKFNKMPAIIAGSGPSLSNSIEVLQKHQSDIPVLSCLHNFHYMVDNNIRVNYFVTLDAGDVTLEEISEGGQKTHEEYVELTKGHTLLAYIGTSPKLLDSWKGEVLFFNAPIPEPELMKEIDDIESFPIFISNGGNVLGACMYIAKGILGCTPICFIGADFCFSYDNQFHPWKSKYDINLGRYIRAMDIWGNSVRTWDSYYNFKCWFDHMCTKLPGIWINCSEDGILGAYPQGILPSIKQMSLLKFLEAYCLYEQLGPQCLASTVLSEPPCESDKKQQRILLF